MKNKALETIKKIEVNLSICIYDFDNQKYRYVFFFYKKGESKPIHKWIFYLVNNNTDLLKENYFAEINSKNFEVNPNITLFMCTKDTSINIIRVPNSIKYKILAHKIIENDLKDRFGDDVGERYYVDNTVVENYNKKLAGEKQAKKKRNSIVTYQQILVPKELLHITRMNLAQLNLFMEDVKSLPSALYKYYLNESKSANELIFYNEANFTVIMGFANNKIIDSIFIEGASRIKKEDGEVINFHLHKITNIVASMLWTCQKNGVAIENATLISNSPHNIEAFTKKENIFGLKFDVVNLTDSIFGDIIQTDKNDIKTSKPIKKVRESKINNAFTLAETVSAVAILAVVVSVAAGIMIAVNSMNRKNIDIIKTNEYIKNVREVINNIEGNQILKYLTSYDLPNDSDEYSGTYFINTNAELSPLTSADKGYQIDFFYKETPINETITNYVFTIEDIKALNNNKNILSDITFEVIK